VTITTAVGLGVWKISQEGSASNTINTIASNIPVQANSNAPVPANANAAAAKPERQSKTLKVNGAELNFVYIPAGQFSMGTDQAELDAIFESLRAENLAVPAGFADEVPQTPGQDQQGILDRSLRGDAETMESDNGNLVAGL
jgi:hypothetical protein